VASRLRSSSRNGCCSHCLPADHRLAEALEVEALEIETLCDETLSGNRPGSKHVVGDLWPDAVPSLAPDDGITSEPRVS
jgi:hypothetical protein